jgi:uncharacterized cofD-like protein
LRIVSIGGGNGLSTLLRGLKRFAVASRGSVEITAIVTVTDDGGSSGRLRREFDVLPPGDIRNCMVALSQDETLLARLFQHRFTSGRGLKGHSFGNLFLTAMTELTGDFSHAVQLSSEVLSVLGRIYPSTAANVTLEAELADGRRLEGETRIVRGVVRANVHIKRVRLLPRRPLPLRETLEAIAKADVITLGPGSLFTSVIPNLLVKGIPEAIAKSAAQKIYFVNLMSQPGETIHFRASDHVKAILDHSRAPVIDICVLNTGRIRGKVLEHYRRQAARVVENDADELLKLGVEVLEADLVRLHGLHAAAKIRHDSNSIAAVAVELAQRARLEKSQQRKSGIQTGAKERS